MKASPVIQPRRPATWAIVALIVVLGVVVQSLWAGAPARADSAVETPVRFEGYILALGPQKWQVGNILEGVRTIWVNPDTAYIPKEPVTAQVGAWCIVYARLNAANELHAYLIQIEFPAGAPPIHIQFTGILRKIGERLWLVDDTPVEVTPDTVIVGDPQVGSRVWVSAVIGSSVLRAVRIQVMDGKSPYEFRGTIREVGDGYVNIDGLKVWLAPETDQYGAIAVGADVECQAVEAAGNQLVATYLRVLPPTVDGERISGMVQSIGSSNDGAQMWLLIRDGMGRLDATPTPVLLRVDGNTWIDQSRGLAQENEWVTARATDLGNGIYQADRVRVEHGVETGGNAAVALSHPAPASLSPWSETTDIAGKLDNADDPILAFTPDGVAHAVWETDNRLQYSKRLPDGSWSTPQQIAYGFSPYMIADQNGALHVTFVNLFMGNYETYYITLPRNGVWTLPVNMSHTSGYSTQPRLTIASDHVLHAVWMDKTPGYWTVYHATWDGSYWSNRPIPSARGEAPAIAAAPDGTIYVAWQDWSPYDLHLGGYEIYLSELRDGAWDAPVSISASAQVDSLGPDVTTTSDSRAHVVWVEGGAQIRYSFGQGAYWSVPTTIWTAPGCGHAPRVLAQTDDFLYVAWDEDMVLRAASAPAGSRVWPDVSQWEIQSGTLYDVSLAPIATGGIALAWAAHDNEGHAGVYARLRIPLRMYQTWVPLFLWHQPLGDPIVP